MGLRRKCFQLLSNFLADFSNVISKTQRVIKIFLRYIYSSLQKTGGTWYCVYATEPEPCFLHCLGSSSNVNNLPLARDPLKMSSSNQPHIKPVEWFPYELLLVSQQTTCSSLGASYSLKDWRKTSSETTFSSNMVLTTNALLNITGKYPRSSWSLVIIRPKAAQWLL